jgi:hypothetical protein
MTVMGLVLCWAGLASAQGITFGGSGVIIRIRTSLSISTLIGIEM